MFQQMQKRIVIFDIDGTLSKITGIRKQAVHTRDWETFHKYAIFEEPNPAAVALAKTIGPSSNCSNVIITTRPEEWRFETTWWLTIHDVPYCALWMRKTGDLRPSREIKREYLGELLMGGFDVIAAFEDHPEVIAAYQAIGVSTIQIPSEHYKEKRQ